VPDGRDADHTLLVAASRIPAHSNAANIDERYDAASESLDCVLYVPARLGDDLGNAIGLMPEWREECRRHTGELTPLVVTQDLHSLDWRGERWRRGFDPSGVSGADGWRHVEVSALQQLTEPLFRLAQAKLPARLRLSPPEEQGQTTRPGTGTKPAASPGGPSDRASVRGDLAKIWSEALGVSAVAPADSFTASGGESLMAVELLARARTELSLDIPLTEFWKAPTFERLTQLAEQSAAVSRSVPAFQHDNLVVLSSKGTETPLFLAAPAAGSSLCYGPLAEALVGQPCFGLDSPGLHDGRPLASTVAAIAAHHVEVIRKVRPRGPYRVGGWSTGAIVAHEVARYLHELGERVDLLLIDGHAPNTRGLPIAALPRWQTLGVLRLYIESITGVGWFHGLTRTLKLTRQGAPQVFEQQIRQYHQRSRGQDREGFRFLEVYRATLLAVLRYTPPRLACRMLLCKAGSSAKLNIRIRSELEVMYGGGGVEVVGVAGDHWSLLEAQHVVVLARSVLEFFARAEESQSE